MVKNSYWFHCGRCGSLFRARSLATDVRVCTNCGRSPFLGFGAVAPEVQSQPAMADIQVRHDTRNSRRKRKMLPVMAKVLLGWLALVVVIVVGAQFLVGTGFETKKPESAPQSQVAASEADAALINRAMPLLQKTIGSFVDARTPEEWSQFILAPIAAAGRIDRYYSFNPRMNVVTERLNLTHFGIVNLPAGKAIECYWGADGGEVLDTVFVEENGEWLLDWNHYVRYSDYPWASFLAGGGDEVGEFRLLARERLADERKNEDTISIALYAPYLGDPGKLGLASPEFLIKRSSKNGRMLDAAFKLNKNGKHVFDSILPSIDPQGLVRVRVKVRRVKEADKNQFELEEVIACHWFSTDVPGVEIPEDTPAK